MAIAIASRILQDTISTSGVLHHRRLPRTIFRCSYSPTGAKGFRSPNSPPLLASLWRSEKSQETFRLGGGFRRSPGTIFRCSSPPTGGKGFRSPNPPPLLASLWRSEKSQETFRLGGGFR